MISFWNYHVRSFDFARHLSFECMRLCYTCFLFQIWVKWRHNKTYLNFISEPGSLRSRRFENTLLFTHKLEARFTAYTRLKDAFVGCLWRIKIAFSVIPFFRTPKDIRT